VKIMKNNDSSRSVAIDESNINVAMVWKVAFIAAMGGLLFGYDIMVIGGTTTFYEHFFGIENSPLLKGLSVGSAPIGCVVGSVFSMLFADRFGRKRLLIWSAILFLISAIGTAFSSDMFSIDDLIVFNVFRLIGGTGIGLAGNISPMYIAEISPTSYRGKVVTTNQLTIMIGMVAAQVANLLISQHGAAAVVSDSVFNWNQLYGWRWMFGLEAIPAIAFLGLAFVIPRSPRWLIKKGHKEEAHQVLSLIGGEQYADQEVADISSTISSEETNVVNFREIFEPKLFKIVLLGMFLALVQQWAGLNSIFNFSHAIFKDAGLDVSMAMVSIVSQGVTMLVFCILAMFIVDKVGRKKLMLFGSFGIALIHFLIGESFHSGRGGIGVVILMVVAIAIYATTLAPVMWVLLAELFPNRVRGVALGISVTTLWVSNFAVAQTFPIMREAWGTSGTFWFYGGFLFFAGIVLKFTLPETKGKSLEQIERDILK